MLYPPDTVKAPLDQTRPLRFNEKGNEEKKTVLKEKNLNIQLKKKKKRERRKKKVQPVTESRKKMNCELVKRSTVVSV